MMGTDFRYISDRSPDFYPFLDVCRFPRRILLLTSSLGSGHNRAGEAIKHALLERDPATMIREIDFWSLMDQGIANVVKEAYLELVIRHPDIYDNLYQYDWHAWCRLVVEGCIPEPVKELVRGLRTLPLMGATRELSGQRNPLDCALFTFFISSLTAPLQSSAVRFIRRGLLKWVLSVLVRRLWSKVVRFSPDVIIATHLHPAALVPGLRRWRSMGPSTVVAVLTDYDAHDLWAQTYTDYYCVPTEEAARDLEIRGVSSNCIHITGIPLMPGFRRLPSCTQAREELGLDSARPTVLVAGGGLGLGLHRVVEGLVREGPAWQVLVAAGHNSEVLELLSPLAAEVPTQVRLFGWTERMETLMRAADVVVTKPGGLTLAEALACGRPLLAPFSLGGQEGFNVRFLEGHGLGGLVPQGQLVDCLQLLFADPRKLACLQDRAWNLGRRDSGERVADLVHEVMNSEARGRGENFFHSRSR